VFLTACKSLVLFLARWFFILSFKKLKTLFFVKSAVFFFFFVGVFFLVFPNKNA